MSQKSSIGILGTGSCLPERRLTNHELESIVETNDEWIVQRTGIRERRIIDKAMPLSDLAAEAARNALADAGLEATDIDMIITPTITPDYLTPSLSCTVQAKIGAVNASAFDINAACSGFVYAISIAEQFMKTGAVKNVLIVAAEALSRATDYQDRKTCVLFGDGAGAVVLGAVDEGQGIRSSLIGAQGEMGGVLTLPAFYDTEEDRSHRREGVKQVIWMDGSEVFTFASRIMTDSIRKVLEEAGIELADLNMVFPHQANTRILQNATKRLKISMDKVYQNLDMVGNTSSASIPICLDEAAKKGLLKKGDNLVLVAFGGGLTYGATAIKWSKD